MCAGIALVESEVPLGLVGRFDLERRLHTRGGEREFRFLWRDREPLLPVWVEGQLTFARWGSRQRKSRLPPTGWTWRATVESGAWSALAPQPVLIPCNFGLEKGVWFRVRQGINGLLVHDEQDTPSVYIICEPPTRYYQVMTLSDRMPCLVEEVI